MNEQRKQDHEKAIENLMNILNLTSEKDRYSIHIVLLGAYGAGKLDAKEEMKKLIEQL